jgi:hypothetical protein
LCVKTNQAELAAAHAAAVDAARAAFARWVPMVLYSLPLRTDTFGGARFVSG